MCGILGSVNRSFGNETMALIKHRGPDDEGLINLNVGCNRIILAHTRLSIVDLSEAGGQPMISVCGNYVIIYNGEIYNHMDLRKKLPHINFKGHSDTETILYYLIEFGIVGVKDFNGIFGFSFLDIKNQKLYIVRDPFGVKPVYYFYRSNNIVFSSEVRPINYLQELNFNTDNLATLLRLRYIPSPNTVYSGVKKIRPGHYIEVDLSQNELKIKEQSFIQALPRTQKITKQNALEKYESYLVEAVRRQLMSDVEVGVLLSGGVDSALIAAIAQKNSDKSLKAFTIGFEGQYKEDEIDNARETADLLGLDHYTRKINFSDFLSMLDDTTRIIEEPIATTSAIPMYYLSQLAAEHVKVVLAGQGADEPLGGYQRYQGEIISGKIPRGMWHWGGRFMNKFDIKNENIIRAVNSLGEKNDVRRFLNIYSIFSYNEIVKILKVKESRALKQIEYFYEVLNCKIKETSVERMMALDTRMNLSDDLLLYTDKITMNFALECRVPMLDLELIEFIESLPKNYRVRRRKTKIIHKEFAKKILPKKIINRPKKGFQSPTQVWFKNYSEEIKELLLKPSLFLDIFNKDEIKKILDAHIQGYNREKQIFLLLSIFFWMKNLNK